MAGRDDRHWLWWPTYGLLEAALGFALFYVLVARVTAVAVTELADALPGLVPEPATTAAAVVLWFVLVVSLGSQVVRQLTEGAKSFDSAAERRAFLGAHRPGAGRFAVGLAMTLAGGALAALSWGAFFASLPGWIRLVARPSGSAVAAFAPRYLLLFVAFFLGFGLFTHGVDRLAVDGLRAAVARTAATDGTR